MKIGILNIDTLKPEFVRDHGDYPTMFAKRFHHIDDSIELVAYNAHQGEYPQDIDEVDAYLITGSKLSVYDDIPWITVLIEFIRELDKRQKTLIGICFGHQLIAQALGGETRKADVGWCVGVHNNKINSKARDVGINASAFRIMSSHQDQVLVTPPRATVLASSDKCHNAMMVIDKHIFSVQGHIEFSHEFMGALIEMRREIFGPALYKEAKASLSEDADHHLVTQWIVDFIKA